VLQNSDPLSVRIAYGKPYVVSMSKTYLATELALLSGHGYAMGHFEKRSVMVRIYLFLFMVSLNGPT